MESKQYTIYNKKKEFEKEILPLLDEVRKKCMLMQIPFFYSTAVANEDNTTDYVSDGILTGSFDIILYDDKFTNFLLAIQEKGFRVVPNIRSEENLAMQVGNYIDDAIELGEMMEEEDDDDTFEEEPSSGNLVSDVVFDL